MKKILTLLALVGLFSLQGCTNNDDVVVDKDTIGLTFENKVPYDFLLSNEYSARFNFPNPIFESDMVLVYRLDGIDSNGRDVWRFLPETHYFNDGTRDFTYNYIFTTSYVNVFLDGNKLNDLPDGVRLKQIFRFVVVPASFGKSLNTTNYNAVISALNINENQIQKINF
jgi:hypothetical protein